MEKIFQVSEFNEYINTYLRTAGEVAVEGEISQLKVSQGKWLFITIKDETANVDIFAPVFSISGWQALLEGMLVRVYGNPGLSQKYGKFSLNAKRIIPAGEGALRLAFEKLKIELEREGLFASGRKRLINKFPQHIGLITAKDSEAYNDFVKVLRERMGGLSITFFPVNVQGKDAPDSIRGAFVYLNQHPELQLDCVVLCRGGGSLADLQAFNDEQVVRAVFSSQVPVVVGVGHERDVSLCDLVADLRASTPSNAAELLVHHRRELLDQVEYAVSVCDQALQHEIVSVHTKIEFSQRHMVAGIEQIILRAHQRVRHLLSGLQSGIASPLQDIRTVLTRFSSSQFSFTNQLHQSQLQNTTTIMRLHNSMHYWLNQQQTSLQHTSRLLDSFNHQKILDRGYSLTHTSSGQLLTSVAQAPSGSHITTQLKDGIINSDVI